MRREILYLSDIEASGQMGAFIAGIDFEQFQQSELIRSAVMQKLTIIARLPGDFLQQSGAALLKCRGCRS